MAWACFLVFSALSCTSGTAASSRRKAVGLIEQVLVVGIAAQQFLPLQERPAAAAVPSAPSSTQRSDSNRPPKGKVRKEAVPPGTVGNFHGQLVVLAVDGRFEPVLVDQAMRDAERGERFHGVGQPVGGLRIAEHDLVKIDCRPRGADVAAAAARIVFVDLLHVEQPERARPHED